MTKAQWAAVLREHAAKANPALGHVLREIAARNDAAADERGEWIGPAREPGEEG